jgi:hypothetical protein
MLADKLNNYQLFKKELIPWKYVCLPTSVHSLTKWSKYISEEFLLQGCHAVWLL